MIKAIIFDFFGVLVTEGFKRFCDEYFPGDPAKRRQAVGLVTAHDGGYISQDEYVAGIAELANTDKATVLAHMAGNQPNDSLLNYICTVLKSKYKLGVLSNSGDDYLSQILPPKDVEMFDDIVLSFRHGVVKPESRSFELAAERLGVKPAECLFIDDSQSHCVAAEQIGMQAILYKNFAQFKKDLEKIRG
jgi:epoxide hydrolase-like predicted phosphatase